MANSIPKIVYNNGVSDVEILFEYPPQGLDFEGQTIRFVGKTTEAANGQYQTSDNFTEDERNFRFRQVKKSIKDQVDTFMLFIGPKRKTFKYFIHSDEIDFLEVQLSRRLNSYRPKRTGWNSKDELTYEFQIRFRRVL